ncbi:MAG: Molybdopterin-guanine dinucleotide biosynthesis protein [Pelotomaculum thermopropionicum]|uniref:Molybdopterin-guanine dinucleotide biosynthesis protein n=1 Tax=Pelotomaculum thermopropionicum TaxID=110500 RepID=A0A117M2S7_9FIRM|nr:MAG: Molybdopterin-guanine dinucleotide biosynthesis protein [Pelotomaculum thermopropionicum]
MGKTCPAVGLTGFSGSGKTTLLEKLIVELKHRGYRVGVIKHTHHRLDFDREGKDSWRHTRAGADVVALAAPGGVTLVRKFDSDPEPDEVLAMIGGVDLIIIEGYKRGRWPKIEVFRRGMTERPAVPEEELLAVVSDEVSSGNGIPHFDLDDVPAVADLIESKIIF